MATEEDAKGISAVLSKVFPVYPVPTSAEYIKKVLQSGETVFAVIQRKEDGKIISVASAEITSAKRCAEISDCATLEEYKGHNLMCFLFIALEELLVKKDIPFLFSLTRAISPSMNITTAKLGYRYTGRLINNCIISTGLEDMNVWVKPLKPICD